MRTRYVYILLSTCLLVTFFSHSSEFKKLHITIPKNRNEDGPLSDLKKRARALGATITIITGSHCITIHPSPWEKESVNINMSDILSPHKKPSPTITVYSP